MNARTGERTSRPRERRRGQALVELASAIVVFLLVICSIYEFGWALYNYSYLSHVIESVTRGGRVGDTNATIISNAAAATGGLAITITASDIVVTNPAGTVQTNTDRTAGNFLSVTGRMTYSSLTPLSRLVTIAGFGTFTVTAIGRIE